MTAAAAMILAVASCSSVGGTYNKGDRMPQTTDSSIDTVSYSLGVYFGKMIETAQFGELDLSEISRAFNDVINKKDLKISDEEVGRIIQMHLMERQSYLAEKNKTEGEEFLLANKDKEGVVETESGLQYKVLVEGSGIAPAGTDTVEVHYTGRLLDGTEFDASDKEGDPVRFPLNRVIKGWTEGITYMKEGGKIELYIPADLAYGQRGTGPIPGNSTLIFEVELIKVHPFVESSDNGKKASKK